MRPDVSNPQRWDVAVDLDVMGCAVDLQRESHGCLLSALAVSGEPTNTHASKFFGKIKLPDAVYSEKLDSD
jgi:hypothetical protein